VYTPYGDKRMYEEIEISADKVKQYIYDLDLDERQLTQVISFCRRRIKQIEEIDTKNAIWVKNTFGV